MIITRRHALTALATGIVAAPAVLRTGHAQAAQVTLKIHHFLPAQSNAHKFWLEPWARKVEQESGGKIKVEVYPSMQLGGRPPQLFDQARDGVVDVVWTLAGNTPGRFAKLEAFELPFVPHAKAAVTSPAVHEFYEMHARDELKDVKVLAVFAHGAGHFFTKDKAVKTPEDVKGMKIRVPNRPINNTLQSLGASPQGIPAPGVPEALSKGVVDGVVFPYEVVPSLKVDELTNRVGEFQGDRSLYTAVFLFVMNKPKYDSMPAELKTVIDANAGLPLAKDLGSKWDAWDSFGREAIAKRNTPVTRIEGADLDAWKKATRPALEQWVKDQKDGAETVKLAEAAVAKYSAGTH